MADNRITFDQLPEVVQSLSNKMDHIEALLNSLIGNIAYKEENEWLTIEELANYLPNKPAISTLRDKARRKEIPCAKQGNRWLFNKASIDKWLHSKQNKTTANIKVEAGRYVNTSYANKAINT